MLTADSDLLPSSVLRRHDWTKVAAASAALALNMPGARLVPRPRWPPKPTSQGVRSTTSTPVWCSSVTVRKAPGFAVLRQQSALDPWRNPHHTTLKGGWAPAKHRLRCPSLRGHPRTRSPQLDALDYICAPKLAALIRAQACLRHAVFGPEAKSCRTNTGTESTATHVKSQRWFPASRQHECAIYL